MPLNSPRFVPRMTSNALTDDEWRTLLHLILRHVGSDRFQQWDTFSLALTGTTDRLYVHWGLKPPHGDEYATEYPLINPQTGTVDPPEAIG